MKLNHVPGDLVDGIFGSEEDRIALERAARPVTEIEFAVPDATGDCSGIVDEIEEAELTKLLCGFSDSGTGTGGVVKTPAGVLVTLKGERISLPKGLVTQFSCGFVGKLPERWYKSDVSKATRSFLNAALDDNVSATELARLQALANAS